LLTISDENAVHAMRRLAQGSEADIPIVAGESGVAGLAALQILVRDSETAKKVGIDSNSRVLIISTEGATAPTVYESLVGESGEAVIARQRQWQIQKQLWLEERRSTSSDQPK
jgi:diaminopropionate ammonia-lyase